MIGPSRQPCWSRTSPAGDDMASSLVMTNIPRFSSGIRVDQAFMASTTLAAVIRPSGVSTAGFTARTSRVIGVFSKIVTPRARATRLRPRTSLAGCMVAADASKTPQRYPGALTRSLRVALSRISKGVSPNLKSASKIGFQRPSWRGQVEPQIQPTRANSMSLASAKSAIDWIAAWDSWQRRSASSTPHCSTRASIFDHRGKAMPESRPLAPPPQISASTTAMESDGASSRSRIAVHKPR